MGVMGCAQVMLCMYARTYVHMQVCVIHNTDEAITHATETRVAHGRGLGCGTSKVHPRATDWLPEPAPGICGLR